MSETFVKWTSEIDEALHNGQVEIDFEKKDGTIRHMIATLVGSLIPSEKTPKGVKQYNHDVIARVFDVEKQDWRTITKDRLLGWKIV